MALLPAVDESTFLALSKRLHQLLKKNPALSMPLTLSQFRETMIQAVGHPSLHDARQAWERQTLAEQKPTVQIPPEEKAHTAQLTGHDNSSMPPSAFSERPLASSDTDNRDLLAEFWAEDLQLMQAYLPTESPEVRSPPKDISSQAAQESPESLNFWDEAVAAYGEGTSALLAWAQAHPGRLEAMLGYGLGAVELSFHKIRSFGELLLCDGKAGEEAYLALVNEGHLFAQGDHLLRYAQKNIPRTKPYRPDDGGLRSTLNWFYAHLSQEELQCAVEAILKDPEFQNNRHKNSWIMRTDHEGQRLSDELKHFLVRFIQEKNTNKNLLDSVNLFSLTQLGQWETVREKMTAGSNKKTYSKKDRKNAEKEVLRQRRFDELAYWITHGSDSNQAFEALLRGFEYAIRHQSKEAFDTFFALIEKYPYEQPTDFLKPEKTDLLTLLIQHGEPDKVNGLLQAYSRQLPEDQRRRERTREIDYLARQAILKGPWKSSEDQHAAWDMAFPPLDPDASEQDIQQRKLMMSGHLRSVIDDMAPALARPPSSDEATLNFLGTIDFLLAKGADPCDNGHHWVIDTYTIHNANAFGLWLAHSKFNPKWAALMKKRGCNLNELVVMLGQHSMENFECPAVAAGILIGKINPLALEEWEKLGDILPPPPIVLEKLLRKFFREPSWWSDGKNLPVNTAKGMTLINASLKSLNTLPHAIQLAWKHMVYPEQMIAWKNSSNTLPSRWDVSEWFYNFGHERLRSMVQQAMAWGVDLLGPINKENETLLHWATVSAEDSSGHDQHAQALIQDLLNAGADPLARTKEGHTPKQWVQKECEQVRLEHRNARLALLHDHEMKVKSTRRLSHP